MLSNSDLEFLINLQNQLKTQNTDCQASPRFWVVGEEKKEFGIEDGYEDGTVLIDTDLYDDEVANEIEEASSCIIKKYNDTLSTEQLINISNAYSIEELASYLNEIGYDNYKSLNYKINKTIAENTLFITKESCKQHIQKNSYNYKNPHTYAMTAWRSPEIERLWKILEETDWNKYIIEQ